MATSTRIARTERGFTLIEVLIGLVLMVIALAGILGIYNTANKGNRLGDQLSRATRVGEDVMETVHGKTVAEIQALGALSDVVASGVTYHRSVAVTAVSGQANLAMVTVTVSFGTDGDETADGLRTLVLQSLRTRLETF